MKPYGVLTFILALVLAIPSVALAQEEQEEEDTEGAGLRTDLVINALPASILVEIDSDKFAVTSRDGRRTTISTVYTMPNIAAGVGLEIEKLYVDLTAGVGLLINDTFRSFLVQAAVAGTFAVSESLTLGPRAGVVHFTDPEWLEDDSVDFDGATGWLLGAQLAMGDKIMYLVSVDLINVDFETDFRMGAVSEDDELDLTGLAVQFGVRGEF